MRRIVVGLVAVCVLAGGCGGDDAEDDAAGAPTTSEATTADPVEEGQTEADLESRLLTVDDLPSGWSIDNSSDDEDEESPLECLDVDDREKLSTSDASADFIGDPSGIPALSHFVSSFPSGQTEEAFRRTAELLDDCGEFSYEEDGSEVTGQVGRMSFPSLGEASAAWQVAFDAEGFTFAMAIVMFRKGDFAAQLILIDLGQPSLTELERLAEIAESRL